MDWVWAVAGMGIRDAGAEGDCDMIRSAFLLVFGFATGVLVTTTAQEWKEVKQPVRAPTVYETVMCPPDWKSQVAQEYIDRRADGTIKKRTWIRRCI